MHLTPRPTKDLWGSNYLNIANDDFNFAKQFLPEVYEKEVERYGNRTISGFLRMVGAEMPMASDQVIWSEQGRLHIAYEISGTTVKVADASANTIDVPSGHLIQNHDTIIVANAAASKVMKCLVVADNTSATRITVAPYTQADLAASSGFSDAEAVNIFVYGTEYKKGSSETSRSMDASFTKFSNKPAIIRDRYQVNGSDTAQIGWVEVTSENGASGYLWYLKSEHEARLRFNDYIEMMMIEGESAAANFAGSGDYAVGGTQGLFSAINARGNVEVGFTAAAGIDAFDAILKNLDTQGAIEENMLFLQRQTSLDFDDMLASISGGFAGGTAFGLFENSEEMALNLGFSGFRRGSYDFYKTDWKYLNDFSTRGGFGDIEGVLVPAGTSTVYDQVLGSNIKRPFLHIRYRASETENRKMKSWVTGSVGGASSSPIDEMRMHYLSERCLIVQGANNFVLFKA